MNKFSIKFSNYYMHILYDLLIKKLMKKNSYLNIYKYNN